MQGLFDLLSSDTDSGWGIAVISKSGGTLETASAFRILLGKLRAACGGNKKQLAERGRAGDRDQRKTV